MRCLMLLLAAAGAAFSQTEPSVVAITASRQLNSQPDQVTVGVSVTIDSGQGIDAALALLQGTDITAADLSNVGATFGTGSVPQVQWNFTRVVSVADMSTLLGALKLSGQVSVFVSDGSASTEAAVSQQCPYPALINDARAQAAKLASAAGVTVGPIVSITQGGSSAPVAAASFISGDFSLGGMLAVPDPLGGIIPVLRPLSWFLASALPSAACTLTVQFRLGQ